MPTRAWARRGETRVELPTDQRAHAGVGQAFARLSVFWGGFTPEAAQAVAGADVRTLRELAHKSFVQQGAEGRWHVHELLRQYGAARLLEMPGEPEGSAERHCAYYSELLDREKEQIDRGYGQQETVPELDNIRAAWQHAVSHRLTANLKSLLGVLGALHLLSSQERDVALGRAVDALRSGHSGSFTREEATVLGMLLRFRAYAAFLCGREQQVSQLLQESEEILRDLGETVELAWVLAERAIMGVVESSAEAEQLLLEALAIWREADEQRSIAHALHALGECAIRRGAYREAERHCQEALKINERLDSRLVAGYALMIWGYAAYLQGEYARARRLCERCMLIELAIGDPTHIAATHYFSARLPWPQASTRMPHGTFNEHSSDSRTCRSHGLLRFVGSVGEADSLSPGWGMSPLPQVTRRQPKDATHRHSKSLQMNHIPS